jgi:hypothetical protein
MGLENYAAISISECMETKLEMRSTMIWTEDILPDVMGRTAIDTNIGCIAAGKNPQPSKIAYV